MNSDTIRVSVILVTFNSLPAIQESLSALQRQCANFQGEIILVDNGSDDGTPDFVRQQFPDVFLIRSKENVGFAAACNLGASKAQGEFVLFHNPDLVLDDGALDNLVEEVSRIDHFGAASGRMRFPDGAFQATCRNFPTITNLIFSRGSFLSRFWGRTTAYTLPDYADTTEVPAVAGTLMIVRRDSFTELGGFDARYFMYMEDTDLCLRLSKAGFHNYFVPSAGGVHLWGEGSRAGKMRRALYHHRSVRKYFAKHFPGVASFLILPTLLSVKLVITGLFPSRKKR